MVLYGPVRSYAVLYGPMRSCTVLLWSSDEAPQSTSHSGSPALPLSLCGHRVCVSVALSTPLCCGCVGVGGGGEIGECSPMCFVWEGGGSIKSPCAACLGSSGYRHRCRPALLRLRPPDTVSAWRVCRVTPRDTVSGGVSAALFELRRPPPGWLSRLLSCWTARRLDGGWWAAVFTPGQPRRLHR